MNQTYNMNENKINNLLDEIESDRNKYFSEIKVSKESDYLKENKILCLEQLQKALLKYKKILTKEKEKSEKY
jgi:glycyl-tRNA synthetase beta subunit